MDRGKETFGEWVISSRTEQGLPEHVEDIETLTQIAELLDVNTSSKNEEAK